MEKILEYLDNKYQPLAVIVYGSYADHTATADSDFDAVIITEDHPYLHDTSKVNGTPLDVFVYPKCQFTSAYDPDTVLPVADGIILKDTDNLAKNVKQRVTEYLNAQPVPTRIEVRDAIAWLRKMQRRAARRDAEGLFRKYRLIVESLEIFCDAVGRRYDGPKRTLAFMRDAYPVAHARYLEVLDNPADSAALDAWLDCLEALI